MLGFPVPQGYDIAQHVRFASSYQDAILAGVFVPSWAQSENFGFGSVGIRFYPPFADYVLAVTQFVTHDWYDTFLINGFLWMVPGCLGVFFWVREFRSSSTAFLAAGIYALMPYHLLQIYRMQLYSEFVASAILPFCFLFATRLVRRGNSLDIVGLGASCALLILTHLPASLIGAITLTVYVALLIDWRDPLRTLGRLAIATLLSLSLTSFYLVRLLTEIDWVKHSGTEFSSGFFDHRRHLFPIINSFGADYWYFSLWRLDIPIILALGLLVLLIIWCIKLGSSGSLHAFDRKIILAIALTGLLSVFMLSSISSFVWNAAESLQKIQFPWRFLAVASLMASVSAACAISLISDRSGGLDRVLGFAAIALIVVSVFFDLKEVIPITNRPMREDFYKLSVDTRDSEGCECWWPKWAQRGALENRELVSAGGREVVITRWEPVRREFTIGEGEPMKIRAATFFYPYWKGKVNDQPVEIGKDENGALVVPIQDEPSRVEIYFEEPTQLKIAWYISFISWTAMSMIAIFSLLSRFRKSRFTLAETYE